MSGDQSMNIPHTSILVEIVLAPLAGEEDDFQTMTTLEEIRDDILATAATLPDYTISAGSSATRDGGILLLAGEIARQILAQQDLVVEMFKAGAAAIHLLTKRGHDHIKRIEVTLDGDRFTIDEPDKVTAQRLLDTWEAKHPGKAAGSTPSTLQVTGVISKT